MNSKSINHQIRQIIVLSLLLLMTYVVIKELRIFFPGLLGALTIYILARKSYLNLVEHKKWPKRWTAGLYLVGCFLIPVSLGYATFLLLGSRLHIFFDQPSLIFQKAKEAVELMQHKEGFSFLSDKALGEFQNTLSILATRLVNSSVNLIANEAILLFTLYYLLVQSRDIESYLLKRIPLKSSNINLLANETIRVVKASALGIPLISIIQGATAILGYIVFDIPDFLLWGFLTGIFAFFPILGTMIIWVPLVIYLYIKGEPWNATGLFFYSLIITGNIDYLSRITILKKLGQIHPVVTVLGIIIGLNLFGFVGYIFGPLLVNYIIIVYRIYMNEFVENESIQNGSM